MSEITDWTGRVQHGDSRELLRKLPDDSVDLVFTDPPYNISEGKSDLEGLDEMGRRGPHGGLGSVKQNYGDWDENEVMPKDWVPQMERVLKEQGVAFVFYDPLEMHLMKKALEAVGFEYFTKAYWVKDNPVPSVRVNRWMTAVEEMWMAARGGGRSHWMNEELPQQTHAIHAPIVNGKQRTEHPTQKPVRVARKAIEYFCPEDGIVLDPFVGSGTTAIAAEKAGRDWLVIEREEEYVEMARDRLRSETMHEGDDAMEVEW